MATFYEGWEASVLYKSPEVTPGTPLTPDTAFGICKNVNARGNNNLEDEGALGTPYTVTLEEGVIEVGGSLEFLPVNITALELAERNGSGILPYFTMFAGAGPGVYHTGCKINTLRLSIEAGGRLRCNMDWFALSKVNASFIAAIIPTDETFNWIKLVTDLDDEVQSIEMNINHNLTRRPAIANASAPWPVSGQKRPPIVIKEGRQSSVTATVRFFSRPTDSLTDDVLAYFSHVLTFTGLVGGDPLAFTISLGNGKYNSEEFTASEGGDAGWPVEYRFKTIAFAEV